MTHGFTKPSLTPSEATFGKRPADRQIQIQTTRAEFEGDRTLVVFPLAGMAGAPPHGAADTLGQALTEGCDWISGFNVVKGFLNLTLTDACWNDALQAALTQSDWGHAPAGSKPQVMVEYSSPNTNKPLHLGHLRNNFLGYSVSRILEAAGHDVKKVQIINDRGIHICKSMVAWQKLGQGETPASTGEKGDKLVGRYYVAFDKAFKAEVAEGVAKDSTPKKPKRPAPCCKKPAQCCNAGKKATKRSWRFGKP